MTLEPTVFAVDDDPGVREALGVLLNSVGRPVELFPSAEAFLNAFDPNRPGCLILDIRMPGRSGLELQSLLRAQGHDIPIVIITGHGDVTTAVRALKLGAVDFIEKPFNDQLLLDRIDHALRLDAQNRRERTLRESRQERLARLSPREHEVLQRLLSGQSCKQIAAEFQISYQAAAAHRTRILTKMEANGVVDLIRLLVAPPIPCEECTPEVEQLNWSRAQA